MYPIRLCPLVHNRANRKSAHPKSIVYLVVFLYDMYVKVPTCEAAKANTMTGGPDLSFGFPWNGKIPHPHQAAWSQPINRRPKGNKGNMRESGKARKRLSLNKSPWKFVPIELLCKHVTNPLKPATNCLCSPYKFGYQLGLGALWPCTTALDAAGALARVSNKLPFCKLHCRGSLLSSRSGIQTSGKTFGGSSGIPWPGEKNACKTEGKDK